MSVTDNWYLSGELHIESEASNRPDKDAWQDHFGHPNIWGKFSKIATVRMWGLQNCYGLLQNWDTDSLFIGLKDEGSNRKDAVIAFGDDADESLRFLFTGAGFPPPPPKELLRITGSGNVGIKTINPSYLLDVNGEVRANRYYGLNSLKLNDYQTVNPASNVYLYSTANDRDSWLFLDSADTGSNWGIYHRQIDSPIKQLPANSIGFIGGGNSDLKAYICLGDGSAYFKGDVAIGSKHALRGNDAWLRLNQDKLFKGVHTPGLFFPGSLNVGGDSDPGYGNALFTGNVVIGAGGNASLRVRHIDGKHPQNDQHAGLHLNWSNGQPVYIGGTGGDGNASSLYVTGSITYSGQLNKLDVAESDGFAYIRAHDLLFGHSLRRGEMGRALVDEIKNITVFPQPTKSMKTLHINYGADWQAVYISGIVQTPSSRQLKENISFLSSEAAERIISVLEPVRFTYKQDTLKLECLGFIAEDTPPEVASPTHDAIAINHIVAALTRVVKDQEESINELKAQINLLKKQYI